MAQYHRLMWGSTILPTAADRASELYERQRGSRSPAQSREVTAGDSWRAGLPDNRSNPEFRSEALVCQVSQLPPDRHPTAKQRMELITEIGGIDWKSLSPYHQFEQ